MPANKRFIFFVFIIFIIAFFLRIAYFQNYEPSGYSDENAYHYTALNLLKYHTFMHDRIGEIYNGKTDEIINKAYGQIGYPLYLASIYAISNNSVFAARISNIMLSLGLMFIMFLIMRELKLPDVIVCIVLLFTGLYPGFIYNVSLLLTEHLFVFFLALYAYFFIRALYKKNIIYLILSAVMLGLCIHIRGTGIPFFLLSISFLIIDASRPLISRLKNIALLTCVVFAVLAPWVIRNYLSTGQIFFSLNGYSPMFWGAFPYFTNVGEASEYLTPSEAIKKIFNLDPWLYIRWRIFGFFQYMWGDIWSEGLNHRYLFPRLFVFIHFLIIIPSILLTPLFIKKINLRELFISTFPIVITLSLMPYHGLPRYVWPSIPFVLIFFGIILNKIFFKNTDMNIAEKSNQSSFTNFWVQYFYKYLSLIFSVVLLISLYIFPSFMNSDISEYRLIKYAGTSIEKIEAVNNTAYYEYTADDGNVILENMQYDDGTYYTNNAPAIIKVGNIPLHGDLGKKVISKVSMAIDGGFIIDYFTIYWSGMGGGFGFPENRHYSLKHNMFQKTMTVYIDCDVESLVIIPVVVWNNRFKFSKIIIEKFIVE